MMLTNEMDHSGVMIIAIPVGLLNFETSLDLPSQLDSIYSVGEVSTP